MDVTKPVKPTAGILLSLLIIGVPSFGWMLWYPFERLSSSSDVFFVLMAKIGAFGGLSLFAVSLLLSGRFVVLERLFGGMDKMYIAHRFFGTFGTVLLFIHPLALSLRRIDTDAVSALKLWFPVHNGSILLGAISLYGLIGLIVWSITTKKSYETFVKVHRLLGVLFVFGVIHTFLLGRTLQASSFMYGYILVLSVAATLTFIAYSLLGDILHRPIRYTVLSVRQFPGDILEIVIKPRHRMVRFKAGQFVYAQFPGIAQEYHPFSIASGEHESHMRLVVRKVGDFTQALSVLKTGEPVRIKGPYGGFYLTSKKHDKQLWIAGGVGVTPFLSGARSLKHRNEKGRIEMLYATADKEPYGFEELQQIEERNPSFNVTLFHQDTFGYVSLHLLKDHFKDLPERAIFMCGPAPMMSVIEQEAKELGLEKNLHFEAFTY